MLGLFTKLLINPQKIIGLGLSISLLASGAYILYQKAEIAEAELQVSQFQTENQKLKDRLMVADSNRSLRENEIEILNRKVIEDRKAFEDTCRLLKEIEDDNDEDPVGKILDRLSDSTTNDGK